MQFGYDILCLNTGLRVKKNFQILNTFNEINVVFLLVLVHPVMTSITLRTGRPNCQ